MTTIFGNVVPANRDNSDAVALTIGTYFTPTVNGQATHARWYFPQTIPHPLNPVEYRLYRTSDQVVMGSATFPLGATLDAWNQVAFPSPIDLVAGVQYCAAVRTLRYPNTSGYFVNPITSGELSMPSSAGRFTASPTDFDFPTSTFQNSAYFPDLVFQPAGATTPVSSTSTGKMAVYQRIASSIGGQFRVAQRVISSSIGRFHVDTVVTPPPTVSTAVQIAQRAATMAFIRDDPTTASLTPVTRVKTAGGGFVEQEGLARPPQTFKLSLMAFDTLPTITVAGVERVISYHLIGPHDMEIGVGDYWVDGEGTRWDVVGFTEGWDYMTKALISRHVPRGAKA